ncbi:nuclear transport factor 2 family protein [Tunturiibacter empetritectus]|uniref:PhnB protein n=2 Tax=Tunturiibacter TaxID=3154218 RepID=A0A852VA07_9BACT|nr:nuclear transport factor 2 family protein [Edaphobacter lichenicola]NYF89778.1 PhnB protein [Edaphobacter lichenicola]
MATATMQTDVSKDEAEVLAVIDQLRKMNHEKDAAGFAALFAADVADYNLAPPLSHRGIDLREKQAWFDSWDGPVEVEARDFEVTVSGDVAFCHGFMHMNATSKTAARLVSFWMRSTLQLKREAGQWRITHSHTSVPFYMDGSLRPAFDLQP